MRTRTGKFRFRSPEVTRGPGRKLMDLEQAMQARGRQFLAEVAGITRQAALDVHRDEAARTKILNAARWDRLVREPWSASAIQVRYRAAAVSAQLQREGLNITPTKTRKIVRSIPLTDSGVRPASRGGLSRAYSDQCESLVPTHSSLVPRSGDLRLRIIEAVRAGMSGRAAAAAIGVAVGTAGRWIREWRSSGRTSARHRGGDRRSHRIGRFGNVILSLVDHQADITVLEIAENLRQNHQVSFARSTIWNFLDRRGMTRTKNKDRKPGRRRATLSRCTKNTSANALSASKHP
jgi:transposase